MNSSATADSLAVTVKQVQSLLHQAMDRRLRPLGLTVTQFACLRALHGNPGMSGAELARRLFVSRQSMNGVVTGLEERGYIDRSTPPGPRRDRAATLTDVAVARLREAETAVADVVDGMYRGIPDAELADTLRVLTRVAGNLGG
ncbi:MarR family winged helix-turn-helix transcriptional regulator [Corynebacterium kalidii]|jgi:DNA-binding MarR family transcriptional regulator|uniref:MarR family transcriptional regulator n=1 Tax=Corynebacterium kalidii TaxID=2931982 RepID=A0A9X1WHE4_9CORY|nr:MarR family transcriptional regulator [Corynebacterium kalidii]MCJ7858680.1 MarR family transcriptional regulator [Corynebacterium kalidii]